VDTQDGESPLVYRRAVYLEMTALREAAGLKREDTAAALDGSDKKVGHLETGRNLWSRRDLRDALELYGRLDRLPQLLEWTERAGRKGWWEDQLDPGMVEGFASYVGQEAGVATLDLFDDKVVSGLWQVERYSEAVIRRGNPALEDTEVQQRVSLRKLRQRLLTRPNPPTLRGVLDEAALRRLVGGRDVMCEQLDHLADLAGRPNITLYVLPFAVGAHPGDHAFRILTFPHGVPAQGYIENRFKGEWFAKEAQIAELNRVFGQLVALAPDPSRTPEIIANIKKELL
jgi:hypothetical protein